MSPRFAASRLPRNVMRASIASLAVRFLKSFDWLRPDVFFTPARGTQRAIQDSLQSRQV
jgi:hypothetical protein